MYIRAVCFAALLVASTAAERVVAQEAAQTSEAAPPPEAPPPIGPQVAVGRRIIDAAGAFDGYMHRAAKIDARFTSGAAVARAVEVGSVYEPHQLEEGAIAYAALVALQDPDFVHVIQAAAATQGEREEFGNRIVEHPETVLDAAAARRTATRVAVLLGDMGVKLAAAGSAVKQAAYDVQHEGWSKDPIVTPDKRLARIKAESAMKISLAAPDTRHLVDGLVALRANDGDAREADSATRVVTQGLALAALAILGQAGDDHEGVYAPLLMDTVDEECLDLAKKNEFQCLAVAGPHYEDMFCLGRHAMMDPGHCIAAAAGLADDQLPGVLGVRDVAVPIALASADGPERSSAFSHVAPTTGVSIPIAMPVAPENYSPYSGPAEH